MSRNVGQPEDVALVQQLPTTAPDSIDVLDSLRTVVTPEIFAQLEQRVAFGEKKYGTRLKTNNGRDVILDCKQENLDAIMYSQQAFLEGKDRGVLRRYFIDGAELLNKL